MMRHKKIDANEDVLVRLNNVKVTLQDLWRAARDSEKLPCDQHGHDAGFFLIAKRFYRDRAKAKAVYFRMKALAHLLMAEGAPGWTVPALPNGAIPTQAAVLAAAAVEPLVSVGEDIGFDRASFLNRVLAEAETEGTG